MEAVARKLFPCPATSARHADLDVDGTGIIAEPEVRPQVVLREEAPARADLADLFCAAAADRHSRADGESVSCRGHGAHRHPVMLGRLPILQQRRGLVHVADDEIEIAVVVEISHGKAAADRRDLQARARAFRHVAESGAEVQEQLVLLAVGFAELRESVDVRENVAVGEEQIELSVEVGVEKGGAPAHAAERGGRDTRRVLASSKCRPSTL